VARGHGVVATALELIEIEEVARLTAPGDVFTAAERAYAASKTDPERRLAVRLAAKQAALRLLGGGLGFGDVEILPARGGPPSLRLSPQATLRLRALGATRTLVSLTHGRSHAAATVLALEDA
jgi:holo-[acyl-carrier protein] synthase